MIKYSEQLKLVIEYCGIENINDVKPVFGGDINQTFRLTADEEYFLKINDAARYPKMFEKEANGLNTLRGIANCSVPEVIKYGEVEATQYLVLKWVERGNPKESFWEEFGTALAMLHQRSQPDFGFVEDNYIGSLQQNNEHKKSWAEFYGGNRIFPLAKRLVESHSINKSVLKTSEKFCNELKNIFPDENPSLLHGDLWSGNFMITEEGSAAIFDPAVYYGHREMDIGMTKLFSGFDQRFYEAYNEAYRLEKNWRDRIELTQLYPLLVHAILFGGGYIRQVESIINRFS